MEIFGRDELCVMALVIERSEERDYFCSEMFFVPSDKPLWWKLVCHSFGDRLIALATWSAVNTVPLTISPFSNCLSCRKKAISPNVMHLPQEPTFNGQQILKLHLPIQSTLRQITLKSHSSS
jgi:hypothetical protein